MVQGEYNCGSGLIFDRGKIFPIQYWILNQIVYRNFQLHVLEERFSQPLESSIMLLFGRAESVLQEPEKDLRNHRGYFNGRASP